MRVADYVGVIKVKAPRKSSNCIFTEGWEINAVKIFIGNAVKIFLCKQENVFFFILFCYCLVYKSFAVLSYLSLNFIIYFICITGQYVVRKECLYSKKVRISCLINVITKFPALFVSLYFDLFIALSISKFN